MVSREACDRIFVMRKISKDTVIHQALKSNPATVRVFDAHRMGCKSCGGGKVETVAWGASVHGLDVEAFLRELNEAAESGESHKK